MSLTSPAHSELAFTLTKHYFGEIVAAVIKVLFNYDQASLKLLKLNLPEIKTSNLKRSLLTLVKHQLVDYVRTVKNFSQQYEYSVVPQRVFSFYRISRFIRSIGLREGIIAEGVVFTLTEKALLQPEKLLKESQNHLAQNSQFDQRDIENMIEKLISAQYIVRTSDNLCLNIEKFNRDHRDSLIIKTVYDYHNCENKIQATCRAILELSQDNTADDASITAPVPLIDLSKCLVPSSFEDIEKLERYLDALASEKNNQFVVTSGIHPIKGAMYALNIGSVIDHLVKEHISSMVKTRFGPKCCRVFRVLLMRGPLLLKQIEEIIMLPARDVREYSYMLIKEGFIRNRQVPKTPDNAPGKSVFIMSVELDQVVYGASELCCRSINNLLVRHHHELNKNRILIERSKAVEKLLGNPLNRAGSIPNQEDWIQYFSSHELSQLDRITRTLDRILLAKNQVDETLFIMHSWLKLRPNLEANF